MTKAATWARMVWLLHMILANKTCSYPIMLSYPLMTKVAYRSWITVRMTCITLMGIAYPIICANRVMLLLTSAAMPLCCAVLCSRGYRCAVVIDTVYNTDYVHTVKQCTSVRACSVGSQWAIAAKAMMILVLRAGGTWHDIAWLGRVG